MNEHPHLLFLHIPKTAGISLFYALKKIYGNENTLRYDVLSIENRNKYLSMPHEELYKFRFITGHFTLPVFKSKNISNYKIITVLRDPVDRELSAYFYVKTETKHPLYEKFKNMDLYQYLDHFEKNGIRNFQCWQLCEKPSFEAAKEVIDQDIFLAATNENMIDFYKILQYRMNLPEIEVMHRNKTSFRLSAKELHPDIIQQLRKYTEEDYKLYLYVKNRFREKTLADHQDSIRASASHIPTTEGNR